MKTLSLQKILSFVALELQGFENHEINLLQDYLTAIFTLFDYQYKGLFANEILDSFI